MSRPFENLTGRVFSDLTVLSKPETVPGAKCLWTCRCICGTVKDIKAEALRSGHAKSCGCKARAWNRNPRKHGASRRTDGHSWTREYKAWNRAKVRCYNIKWHRYDRYGGRGIFMAPEWLKDFSTFLADMGPCPPGHELDRIDNDGPYAPGNCRWATRSDQMNHTSATRYVEHAGKRMSVANWARETGISYSCLIGRLNAGWKVEHALSR